MKKYRNNIESVYFTHFILINNKEPKPGYVDVKAHTLNSCDQYGNIFRSIVSVKKLTLYEEGILEIDGEKFFAKQTVLDYVMFNHKWSLYKFETELEELTCQKRYIHQRKN